MSEPTNEESIVDGPVESVNSSTEVEPTLRARISMWLSKRALSSVIVASVVALLVGIGLGHVSTMHHERHGFHQIDDGGYGGAYGGPFQHNNGPGMMGPGNGPDDDGPGMMGPGQGPDQNGQLPPLPSASAATN